MAALADNANVFVGPVLDAFNELERLVLRDGDVAHVQQLMLLALRQAALTTSTGSGSGTTFTRRKP